MKVIYVILIYCAIFTKASFVATVSCEPCKINCEFAICYQIKASGYTEQQCGHVMCNFKSYNVTFEKCTYDGLIGQNCSTGVCHIPEIQGCSEDVFGLGCVEDWLRLSCGSCSQSPCDKCIRHESSEEPYYETCVDSDCHGVKTTKITQFHCPSRLDNHGNECYCCYTLGNQDTRPGLCTDSVPLFSSNEFNAYARTARTAAEFIVHASLIFIMLIGVML